MHLPEIDKYAHLNSFFHSWDPRVKIMSFSILMISIALIPNIPLAMTGFFIAIVFLFLSKIPIIFVVLQLRWVFFLILFFFIVMPFTVTGDAVLKFGIFVVSKKGLELAVLIALRAISIILILFPMFGTAEFHRSLKALQKLKVPSRIIQMLMFTYRYIFVFLEMLNRMSVATKTRLFDKKTDIHTLKTLGNITGMLFIRGYEKTERIYCAMQSRGYTGTLLVRNEFALSKKDVIKAFLIIGIAILLNLARIYI